MASTTLGAPEGAGERLDHCVVYQWRIWRRLRRMPEAAFGDLVQKTKLRAAVAGLARQDRRKEQRLLRPSHTPSLSCALSLSCAAFDGRAVASWLFVTHAEADA